MFPKDFLCRNNWWCEAKKSRARIYPVFLDQLGREIGEKQDNGRRASVPRTGLHGSYYSPVIVIIVAFSSFLSSFCTFVTNWLLFSHKYFPSYPVHPKSVASNYLGNVTFCSSLPNLSMTADLRTTLRAILFQLMKPSRPEVGEKR